MKSDWEVKSLNALIEDETIELSRGEVISNKDLNAFPGDFPVYSSAKKNDGMFGRYGKYMFDEELITWSVDGGGRLFHRTKHKFSVTNVGGILRIKDASVLDYRYLFYVLTFLHSQVIFDWVKKAHPSIIRKIYHNIPLPPILEQKQIVKILDEVFEKIVKAKENAKRNLQNTRELFESYLQNVFSSPGAGWEKKILGDIADVKGGKRVPKGYKLEVKKTNHPYITVSDFTNNGAIDMMDIRYISDEVFEQIKRYTITSEDLYVSIAGTIGKTGIIPKELNGANLTENACKLALKKDIDVKFIYYFTKTRDFKIQARLNTRVAAQPKLALESLKTIRLMVPSLLRQRSIVIKLDMLSDEIKKLEAIYQQKLIDLEELKKSILQKAFSGELAGVQ